MILLFQQCKTIKRRFFVLKFISFKLQAMANNTKDLELAEKLLDLGQQHYAGKELQKAKLAFDYLLKKAELINHKGYQKTALFMLANVHGSHGEIAREIDYLKELLNFDHPETSLIEIHFKLATAYTKLKQFSNAARQYDLAYNACKSISTSFQTRSNVSAMIAIFHMKFEKYKKAIEHFDTSADILSHETLSFELAMVLCMRAICYDRCGSTEETVEACMECVEICKTIKHEWRVGK